MRPSADSLWLRLWSLTTMADSRGRALIRQWRAAFDADPLASKTILGLRGRSAEIWRRTFELLRLESPEYRNAIDDEFSEESRAHCGQLLSTIVAIPKGRAARPDDDPFDFVRTHAEWRARRQVPLVASLHAYRLAHRTYSELTQAALAEEGRAEDIVRSLTMLSTFWMQLFDHVGAVLAEAHAVEEGMIIAQGARGYAALVDGLLRGQRPTDPEAQRLCALCGIRPDMALAVAVARPHGATDSGVVEREVALRSFVRLIEQALSPAAFGRVIDIRGHEVIVIASSESATDRGLASALERAGFARRA